MDTKTTKVYMIKPVEFASQNSALAHKVMTLEKEIRDFQFDILQNNPQAFIIDNEILNVELPYDVWEEYWGKVNDFSKLLRELKEK